MTNNVNSYAQNLLRQKTEKRRKIKKADIFFEIIQNILLFFLNKISLFGAISPFGISFFAAMYPRQEYYFGIISSFLGIIFMGSGVLSIKYVCSLAFYIFFSLLYGKNLKNRKFLSATFSTFSLFFVGMIFVVSDGFLLYDVFMLIFECTIVFFSYFAFDKASEILKYIEKKRSFDNNETLSLVFVISTFILSLSTIKNMDGLSHIISIYIILFLGYVGGFSLSCPVGCVLGLVLSISDVLPSYVLSTYVVCSFVCGLVRRHGKVAVLLTFFVSNTFMMIYLNSSTVPIITFMYMFISSILFLLTPKSIMSYFGPIICPTLKTNLVNPSKRITELVCKKLTLASNAFSELSENFKNIITTTTESEIKNAGLIFDNTAEEVCRKCPNSINCWNKNYENTVLELSSMFEKMSARGKAVEFDASSDFRTNCIHFDDFLESINKNYEIYKVNLSWASKVFETRTLLAEQFKNLSSVLNNINLHFSDGFIYDEILEKKLSLSLSRKGIPIESVKVFYNDCYEISVTFYEENDFSLYNDLIASVIGSIIEVPIYCIKKTHINSFTTLEFSEKNKFSVDIGYAKKSATKNECGDSHIFVPIPSGKYILALSDGMGRGKDAYIQSKTTIQLIKKLLSAGFDKETALRLINTILLFRSENQTFATADISIINLFSGAVEFIKTGASSSFLKTKSAVEKIKCSSLPSGALSTFSADCELLYASDGDYLVMVTDGISDILDDNEKTLEKIIESFDGENAQELADDIIKNAIKKESSKNIDDMTVLVAKVNKVL